MSFGICNSLASVLPKSDIFDASNRFSVLSGGGLFLYKEYAEAFTGRASPLNNECVLPVCSIDGPRGVLNLPRFIVLLVAVGSSIRLRALRVLWNASVLSCAGFASL